MLPAVIYPVVAALLPSAASAAKSCCSRKPPAFFLAGDSTTAVQASNGGGWGNGFLSFLKSPAWGINYGHNGATTVSYVKGGDWANVIAHVENYTADYDVYVTIQFGHNDQKPAANISLAQYQENLENLTSQVKMAGGTPILLTPLTRRAFTDTHNATDSLHNERLATIAAGADTDTRVLDLNQASLEYVDALGSTDAMVYNLNANDTTHLNAWGSIVFGRLVIDLLLGHPPVVEANSTQKRDPGTNPACFAKWFTANETMSYDIWHGLLA